jgi:predicted butyrate kinase (DUF1464 family)
MPRVVGIDPGTVSIDLVGLDDGEVFLDQSLPTSTALANPSIILRLLDEAGPLDLVAGPSGYGLPLIPARDLTEADLRLAYLARPGETGGIGGLRTVLLALATSTAPVVLTPGVIHLPSVPAHRKLDRVDMGTADKVCAAVLAVASCARGRDCAPSDISGIVLELGGAFTAAIAIEDGRIVDGLGETSGAMGARAGGALDGEVAYLAGEIDKSFLFHGGLADAAGTPDASPETLAAPTTARGQIAWDAYVERAVKAVVALTVSVPRARDVLLSGRFAAIDGVATTFRSRLSAVRPDLRVAVLTGFATIAGQAAQGAALLADGLRGGRATDVVERLGIREATGTVLDHLVSISPVDARARLGIA